MLFKLFEFLEQFMIDFYKFHFRNLEIVLVFSRHFQVRIWRVQFTSADEFQLISKSAYIPRCIHKCINMYECTSVGIIDFSWKKNQ